MLVPAKERYEMSFLFYLFHFSFSTIFSPKFQSLYLFPSLTQYFPRKSIFDSALHSSSSAATLTSKTSRGVQTCSTIPPPAILARTRNWTKLDLEQAAAAHW